MFHELLIQVAGTPRKTVTQLRRLSLILNLKVATIRKYCMFEGRLNMLKAGVTYIKQTQAGYGICAVSENYAVELKRERTLFAGLPYLISLDNATDPADIQTSIEKLRALRFEAKGQLQRHCGTSVSPRGEGDGDGSCLGFAWENMAKKWILRITP
eukprot:s1570_g8.t1